MTTGQVPGIDDLRDAAAASCPCGHGGTRAETDRQRPLVTRAAGGDPRAFAELYDDHVDDVYRYLLAWTGEEVGARELTEQVFRGAVTWLPVIADGEGDLTAWLLTAARDAVAQHRGDGWVAGPAQASDQGQDVFAAVERLDDAHREVVVLRLLLGHSLAHTAHLTGYTSRVVEELQLTACSGVWHLLSGAPVEPPPPGDEELRPRRFEQCLAGAYLDPAADPGLSELLAVAEALRQGAPEQVPLPDDAFVKRLRDQLAQALHIGGGAARPAGRSRTGRAFGLVRLHVARHPWVATTIAASAIGVVFGLQMAGGPPARPACGAGQCLVATTQAQAATGAGTGAPPPPRLCPAAPRPRQHPSRAPSPRPPAPRPARPSLPPRSRPPRPPVPTRPTPPTRRRPRPPRRRPPRWDRRPPPRRRQPPCSGARAAVAAPLRGTRRRGPRRSCRECAGWCRAPGR